jgi:hypothetical protein
MSPRSLPRRAGLVLALCAASLLALPVAAGAQAGPAQVRVAHFSPDAPAVDVYVNDDKVLSGVEYKTVSKYLELPAGSYDLAVRPAGAAASSDPVIEPRPRSRPATPTPWPRSAPWPTSPARSSPTT